MYLFQGLFFLLDFNVPAEAVTNFQTEIQNSVKNVYHWEKLYSTRNFFRSKRFRSSKLENGEQGKVCVALFRRPIFTSMSSLHKRKVTRVGEREKQVFIDVTYRCRFDRFFRATVYPPSTRFFHLTIIKRIAAYLCCRTLLHR